MQSARLGLLLLAFVFGTAAMEVTTTVLYTNLTIPVQPRLHESTILYQGFSQGTYRLFTLDIGTKARTEVRNNLLAYLHPLAYGGTHAAWIAYSGGGSGGGGIPTFGGGGGEASYRVDVFAIASKSTTTIPSDDAYKEAIAMDGTSVVWTDYRHSTGTLFPEVYHYALEGGEMSRLSDVSSYKAQVAVDGDHVVWQDYRNAEAGQTNADIYLYDLTAGSEQEVCTNPAYQAQPSVFGDRVVWQDYRNAGADPENADIYLRDLNSGEERSICTAPGYQENPRIYGTIVVWQDYRNVSAADTANVDIYGYDLEAGSEFAITTRAGYQDIPSIHGLRVVWYDVPSKSLYMASLDPTSITVPPRPLTPRTPAGHATGYRSYTAAGRRCVLSPDRHDVVPMRPQHLFRKGVAESAIDN
jgi:beta propeller repeat protein